MLTVAQKTSNMSPLTTIWPKGRSPIYVLVLVHLIGIPSVSALTQKYCSNQNTGSDYSAGTHEIVHARLVGRR